MALKRPVALDEQPSRMSTKEIKHPRRYYRSSDGFYPIERQITSSVGKLWDKVFSQIKDKIDASPGDDRQWMMDRVGREVDLHIKEVKVVGKKKTPFNSKDEPVYDKLWVHPKNRLIMKAVKRPEKPRKRKLAKYLHIKGHHFRVIDGHWYDVELVEVPLKEDFGTNRYGPQPEEGIFPVFDAVAKAKIDSLNSCRGIHGKFVYAKSKRQVDHATIKKYGLADKFAGSPPEGDETGQPRYNMHGVEVGH